MCRSFKVTGRVQGVFFRVSTREVAERLDLNGHAVNLPDGSVEVTVCGDDDAIDELAAWLQVGPARAHVANVVEAAVDCTAPGTFKTG